MFDGGDFLRRLALDMARYGGLAPLARPLVGGVGAILMLHRVTASASSPLGINRHLAITPAFLDALIDDMKDSGYSFVSLDQAVDRLRAPSRSERFATITADDAYRDNLIEALPVLERHGTPFTIYVAPGLIDGTADLWWDIVEEIVAASRGIDIPTPGGAIALETSTPAQKVAAVRRLEQHLTQEVAEEDQRAVLRSLARAARIDIDRPRRKTLMDWNELRTIAAHPLASIGAHTVHHYNLKRLPPERALAEMCDSVALLKDELGIAPRHFAYPYGYGSAVGPREVEIAREAGFVTAVTTRHGVLRPEHADHLLALPRISVNGRFQNVAYLRTMLSGFTTPLANRGKVVVTV